MVVRRVFEVFKNTSRTAESVRKCEWNVMITHERHKQELGSYEHLYPVVVVSFPHETPGFPSIPQGGVDPLHPRCLRSVWRRRSRSGRPLETGRCPSRCHSLHTDVVEMLISS